MNNSEIIFKYEPLWGNWKVDKLLGVGSIGKVYKIYRDEYDEKFFSAVKVISIPTKEQISLFNSTSESNNAEFKKKYFDNVVKNILNEVRMLYDLKGISNIISYEDHLVNKVEGKNEWHIFIRMEYAESLEKSLIDKNISQDEVIKLGIDICKGLKICHNNGILHRDIKEANIFISKNGEYKIGDFSVSRNVSTNSSVKTKVGTLNYMAPEVFKGQSYNKSSDIYSLGIVLYKLLNNRRLPFMPVYPEEFFQEDIENSYIRRMNGEKMLFPANASDDLAKIILKACEFNVKERYNSVEDMETDLEMIIRKNNNSNKENSFYDDKNNEERVESKTLNVFEIENIDEAKKMSISKKVIFSGIAFLVLLVFCIVYFLVLNNKNELNILRKYSHNNMGNISYVDTPGITSNKNTATPEKSLIETDDTTEPKDTLSPDVEDTIEETQMDSIVNLLKNPGAEEETVWQHSNMEDVNFSYSSEEKNSGKYSLKLENTDNSLKPSFYQRASIDLNTNYIFGFNVKIDNVTSTSGRGVNASITFYDENGDFTKKESKYITGTSGWKYYEIKLSSSEFSKSSITIYMGMMEETGVAYYDDMVLYKSD